MTTITRLTCEYKQNPLGIDVLNPRLNWQMQAERRGVRQTAYQVLAASTERQLLDEVDLLWDGGKVDSDQSIHVPYRGPKLNSGQRVYWRVRVWDETEHPIESESAWWEMGLLDRSDWRAQWIGAPFCGGPRTSSPPPYLRKEFQFQKTLLSARLYITSIGLYECQLNGTRVGDALLAPGWTDYSRRIQYQVYDVTRHLQPGVNAIGVILADGWAVGNIAWLGRQHYTDRPRLLAQIELRFTDGSREWVVSDQNWKTTQGPLLESDLLMGESYDARREFAGWDEPAFDDASWWPVQVFADSGAALVATRGPAVKRQEVLQPVAVHKVPALKPRWVFDFGQNLVGWVRLRVQGEAGTTLIIRHAEVLNPDGTLYTANLRTARCTDHYTLKGGGEEVWEPRFTFHGFRYVEVAGLAEEPAIDTVSAVVVHSDMPETGRFECSDPLINQLQHNIVWGQKGNFVDVPTDCPQRDERLGWTGDAQVFIRTAAFNRDISAFFTKWALDLEDSQYSNGAFPSVAPNLAAWSIGEGGPAWADAGVICPWVVYQCFGDRRILEEHYASMQRFMEFLVKTSRDGLRCYEDYIGWKGNGDWLALDGSDGREGATSKELIGTAFYAYSANLLAKIARVLSREEDAALYDAYSQQARHAFVKRFVKPDGRLEKATQTGYVLALGFDLLPERLRPLAAAELVRMIRERDNHLSTGFVGTPILNQVLSKNGHLDFAYALLNQTTWPSWLYPVTQGATTIWERWDGWTHDKGFQDAKMNSFNHYAYGAIGAWMYAVIGGIDIDPEHPAYKNILMHPRPGGGLTFAAAELDSSYGTIRSTWKIDKGFFIWDVIVPPNTTAVVYLPTNPSAPVTESGALIEDNNGCQFLRTEEDCQVYSVVAGSYHFSLPVIC